VVVYYWFWCLVCCCYVWGDVFVFGVDGFGFLVGYYD